MRWLLVLASLASCQCRGGATTPSASAAPPASAAPGPRFLKGQLHVHTDRSGDSHTPPEVVVRWYAERGYDFIVLTDHSHISHAAGTPAMKVFPGVELTQNLKSCDPPPEPGLACLLHVNALLVDGDEDRDLGFIRAGSDRRADRYALAADGARELGGIAQLNHPNLQYGADIDAIMAAAGHGARLLEIANMAFDSHNEGDARHPSTEALWDEALARGAHLYGTASDDAHHYLDADEARARGEDVFTGDRGWVMVWAEPSRESIRRALADGDFYASTGVALERLSLRRAEIAIDTAADAAFEVIGERGAVLATASGRQLRFDPVAHPSRYWRVRIRSGGALAWTQPLWR